MFSKGISSAVLPRKEPYDRGFWHLTLCTLLSSQGSDAPDFRPERLSLRGTSMLFLLPAWFPVTGFEANFIKLYKAKNRFLFCLDLVPLEAGSSAAFPNLWGDER